MMKDDSADTYGEGSQQWQMQHEQPPPPQRKVSRRALLIGGLSSLAAGSILATIVGIELLQHPRPQSHPFLTIPVDTDTAGFFWSPDSKRIAIGSANGVRVLDGQTGHQLWDYQLTRQKGAFFYFLNMNWAPDGSHLYYVNDTTLYALDASSGRLLWMDNLLPNNLISHDTEVEDEMTNLFWSPDGSHCAIGPTTTPHKQEQFVLIWNIAARKLTAVCSLPVAYNSPVNSIEQAWAPDGSWIASIDTYGGIVVWSASGGLPAWSWNYPTYNDASFSTVRPWISWSLRGDTLVSGYFLGTYDLWQASSGKQLFQKKPDVAEDSNHRILAGVSHSPDRTHMTLLAFQDKEHLLLQVWNIQSNQLQFTCQGNLPGETLDVTWSPNGKYLAASYTAGRNSEDSGVQLWDASDGKALAFYNTPFDPFSLFWSPDSHWLAVYTATGEQCESAPFGKCPLTNYVYQIFRI